MRIGTIIIVLNLLTFYKFDDLLKYLKPYMNIPICMKILDQITTFLFGKLLGWKETQMKTFLELTKSSTMCKRGSFWGVFWPKSRFFPIFSDFSRFFPIFPDFSRFFPDFSRFFTIFHDFSPILAKRHPRMTPFYT